MQKEIWLKIEEIFYVATELSGAEREEYLNAACEGDKILLSEITALLAEHECPTSILETSFFEIGLKLLVEPITFNSLEGQSLGNYRIERLIGKGGMGEVYIAQDLLQDRKVAIKLLPEEFAVDAEREQRFRKEARAAALVSHPKVAQIYELCEVDGRNFIVMEYVDGLNLRQYMANNQLNLSEVLDIVIQIADALDAAHAVGVIHRDIKPENVIIELDGAVKVLDFGLAKLIETVVTKPAGEQTMIGSAKTTNRVSTEVGIFLGTPSYMSPEQIHGIEIDKRTDIWSFGVLFYELISGELPFQGILKMDVIAAILTTKPSLLSKTNNQLSEGIIEILEKCLSKEKQNRYQNVSDLSAELSFFTQNYQPEAANNYPPPLKRKNKNAFLQTFSLKNYDFELTKIAPKISKGRFWLLGAAVITIFGSIFGFFLLNRNSDKNLLTGNTGAIRSIALLPFQKINFPSDTELFIENGLYESLKDQLMSDITLIPASDYDRNYSLSEQPDIKSLGNKMQVDLLIEGSVKQMNGQYVITVNLMRVSDGQKIWTRTFSDEINNLPKMDNAMAGHIATALLAALQTDLNKGAEGQSFSFDGVDDCVSIPNSADLNFGTGDFTVSFWVKFNDLANNENGLIHKDNYGSAEAYRGWLFNICDDCAGGGGIGLETRNIAQGIDNHVRYPTSNFQIGKWYHILGIRRLNILYLYVDGVLRAKEAESSPIDVSNEVDLNIGSLGVGSPQFFDGLIDEVRIYNRALSAKETLTPVSHWKAEANANDSAGTNHGILQNGATFAFNDGQKTTSSVLDVSPSIPLETKFTVQEPLPQIKVEEAPQIKKENPLPDNKISEDLIPISWDTTASDFTGEVGQVYSLQCPAQGTPYKVYGSGIYTPDSSICTAAVHAGIINLTRGGEVVIECRVGYPVYGSTLRNGIKSIPWGEHRRSFVIR